MSPAGAAPNVPVVAPAPNSSASARALAASRLITSTVCPALTARPPIAAAIPPDPMMLIVLIFPMTSSFRVVGLTRMRSNRIRVTMIRCLGAVKRLRFNRVRVILILLPQTQEVLVTRSPKAQETAQAKGPKLSKFLCFAVYSANLACGRAYKPILDAVGLTYTQYIAMVALSEADEQTVSELGEKLFLESNTLTPILKKLEQTG